MRRVAWTRLWALALAGGLIIQAVARATAMLGFDEILIIMQLVSAILLTRRHTRSTGVLVGAGVTSIAVLFTVLNGEFEKALVPVLLIGGLLLLGKQLDRHRYGNGRRLTALRDIR